MMNFFYLTISPAVFAVVGLILFLSAQFINRRYKIFVSIAGLLFIVLFFMKLYEIQNDAEQTFVYADRADVNFYFSWFKLSLVGFILWLIAILKITFSRSIPQSTRRTLLFSGAFIFVAGLLLFAILGPLFAAICFPILTFSYFVSFIIYHYSEKLKTA